MRQVGSVFTFPSKNNRSCIVIHTRVIQAQGGVRRVLVHDLMRLLGVAHGSIRRVNPRQVDVMLVLPNIPSIDLNRIAEYFGTKWAVIEEDFIVDFENFAETEYLTMGILVFKSAIPDPEGRSLDDFFDALSVDGGYTVVSGDRSI
jgi:hypothetical protein